jgi:hypothetical protein
LEILVNKFGPQRLLWGRYILKLKTEICILPLQVSGLKLLILMKCSDFPFVVEQCGYSNARKFISLAKSAISLTDEDVEWIMGKTAMTLFKSSWDRHRSGQTWPIV